MLNIFYVDMTAFVADCELCGYVAYKLLENGEYKLLENGTIYAREYI